MRLSMIGSVMFESIAAGLGTSAVGVQLGTDTLTPEALGMAVWTMILCSIGWALFATFSANKMDKMGANFEYTLSTIKSRLGVNAKPIEWPIGAEDEFHGVIDLVTMKAYEFDGKQEEEAKEIEIPADLKDIAEEKRNDLIEAVAEFDDELMETYLDGGEISVD